MGTIFGLVGPLYSFYTFYLGVAMLKKCLQEKALVHSIVVAVCFIVLGIVVGGVLLTSLAGGGSTIHSGPSRVDGRSTPVSDCSIASLRCPSAANSGRSANESAIAAAARGGDDGLQWSGTWIAKGPPERGQRRASSLSQTTVRFQMTSARDAGIPGAM